VFVLVVLLALAPVLNDAALLLLVLGVELLEPPPEEPEPDEDGEEETSVLVNLISRELAPTLMVNDPAGRIHG
jgi:hypothetical protein